MPTPLLVAAAATLAAAVPCPGTESVGESVTVVLPATASHVALTLLARSGCAASKPPSSTAMVMPEPLWVSQAVGACIGVIIESWSVVLSAVS